MRAKPHSPIANEQHSPRKLPAHELTEYIEASLEMLRLVDVEIDLNAASWIMGRDF